MSESSNELREQIARAIHKGMTDFDTYGEGWAHVKDCEECAGCYYDAADAVIDVLTDPPSEGVQVGWGIPFHRGARCEWYLSPLVEGNPAPDERWLPVYARGGSV